MAWDVTVPDTYVDTHTEKTAVKPGVATDKAAQNNIDKGYARLASTDIFYMVAIETPGMWHDMAILLTQEISRRISTITEDIRQTTFLFRLSRLFKG